jgi:hypothetical protein
MATVFTSRIVGVVRASFVAQANATAKAIDTVGGEKTFTVPLRGVADLTNIARFYWCGWTLTPTQLNDLRTAFRQQGGFRVAETALIVKAAVPNVTLDLWLFDGREGQWEPTQVLSALSAATFIPELV